jgi:hypothetical protein
VRTGCSILVEGAKRNIGVATQKAISEVVRSTVKGADGGSDWTDYKCLATARVNPEQSRRCLKFSLTGPWRT